MGNIQDKVGQAKAWYLSKTIIGVVISFIPTIVKFFKPELVVDVDSIVADGFEGAELIAQNADAMWAQLTTLFGALLAIYGRIKAHMGIKLI